MLSIILLMLSGFLTRAFLYAGLAISLAPFVLWTLIATPLRVGRIAATCRSEALINCPGRQRGLLQALLTLIAMLAAPAMLIGALSGSALAFELALLMAAVFLGTSLLVAWHSHAFMKHDPAKVVLSVFPLFLSAQLLHLGARLTTPFVEICVAGFALSVTGLRVVQITGHANRQRTSLRERWQSWFSRRSTQIPHKGILWQVLITTNWIFIYTRFQIDALTMLAPILVMAPRQPEQQRLRAYLRLRWLHGCTRAQLARQSLRICFRHHLLCMAMSMALLSPFVWMGDVAGDKLLFIFIATSLGAVPLLLWQLHIFSRASADIDATASGKWRPGPGWHPLAGVAVLLWLAITVLAYIEFRNNVPVFAAVCGVTSVLLTKLSWTRFHNAFQRIEF